MSLINLTAVILTVNNKTGNIEKDNYLMMYIYCKSRRCSDFRETLAIGAFGITKYYEQKM